MGLLHEILNLTRRTQAYVANKMSIWPASTLLVCQFVSGALADAWGVWAQVTDTGANLLSTDFVTRAGFLDQACASNYTIDTNIYEFEIGWGAVPTVVARARFESATAATGPLPYFIDLRSEQIPAGQLIYYRMRDATGAGQINICFRYYFEVL